MKQKILFVSHCILNTASKVVLFNEEAMAAEEELRLKFLHAALDAGIQLVQLPCPEFTLYGCRRWGHTSNQFDNPFFRQHCRKLIAPALLEVQEYLSAPDRFEVLGFLGIDGSPSCGVDYTGTGNWGGSPYGRADLDEVVASLSLAKKSGIFFDELQAMLKETGLTLRCAGLFAPEPEKAFSFLK